MRGYEVTIKLGVNAESKDEAEQEIKKWIGVLDMPVMIVSVD